MAGTPDELHDRWSVARLYALTVALLLVQFVGFFSPDGTPGAIAGGALALCVAFLAVFPPPPTIAPWLWRGLEATAWILLIVVEPESDERGMRIAATACAFGALLPEGLKGSALRLTAWTVGGFGLAWAGTLLPWEVVAIATLSGIGCSAGLFGLEDHAARRGEASARQNAERQLSELERARGSLQRSSDATADQLVQQERLATLGRLAAGIAHEINNPLAVALTNLQLAERDFDPVLIADAQGALRRIRGIVSDLSRIARPEDVTEHDALEDVHLARMLDTVIELARVVIKGGARIRVETTPGVLIRGRRGRIEQVLLNLLVNAWQALESNGRGTIRLSVEEGVDRVRLFVDDDGPGVPEPIRELVFEPFYTTKGAEGSGLGLAISRSYMRAMGGDLTCSVSPLGGARFVIEMLPVDDRTEVSGMASRELVFPKSQMPPAPAREPVPAPLPGDVRPLLLVVDDEPALRRSIERSLRARWRVITTATTQDAFKICEEEPVDVILCDLTLSEDDGLNLLRLFHTHTPHLLERTVLMSGEPSERQIELARRNRPYLVLKPFDLDVLEEQLRAALAGDRVALWVPPVSGSTPRPAEPWAVG